MHPEELFHMFYQDVTLDMNPPGMPKYQSEGMYLWWRERFMNAFRGIEEPHGLRSWAEGPKMWLAGYRQGSEEKTQ